MIDIHCHILPAIDDGPGDIETSIRMLRLAENDGITHIVATPHFRYGEPPTRDDISERLSLLHEKMADEGIRINLSGGADIRLSYELIEGFEKKTIPSINGSRYFLLELPDLIPPNLDNLIFAAEFEGYIPIITHPERNYTLLSSPEKTAALRESGTLFQLTAMSITGEFGPDIQKFSRMMLKKGMVDFVATDAHSAFRRIPMLSRAYDEVSDILDAGQAEKLCVHNPKAVIENREINIR